MARFSYSALDSRQTLQNGVIEELDKEAVARRLMRNGLKPLEIKNFSGKQETRHSFYPAKFSAKEAD